MTQFDEYPCRMCCYNRNRVCIEQSEPTPKDGKCAKFFLASRSVEEYVKQHGEKSKQKKKEISRFEDLFSSTLEILRDGTIRTQKQKLKQVIETCLSAIIRLEE